MIASLAHAIDELNRIIGRAVSWLSLGCVLTCFAVVLLRYGFNTGLVWLQELYVWQHAALFMVGAGYAFLKGDHVRVDFLTTSLPPHRKAVLNLVGTTVFLLPLLAAVVVYSWAFVARSWDILEGSGQTGGMPGVFLLKSLILVFAALVGLQGVSNAIKDLLVLREAPGAEHPNAPHWRASR